jgi:hypothetical protein
MGLKELYFLDLLEVARLNRTGRISSREVTQALIERIKK